MSKTLVRTVKSPKVKASVSSAVISRAVKTVAAQSSTGVKKDSKRSAVAAASAKARRPSRKSA